MPGLVPGIYVFPAFLQHQRRGWPGQARPWRCGVIAGGV